MRYSKVYNDSTKKKKPFLKILYVILKENIFSYKRKKKAINVICLNFFAVNKCRCAVNADTDKNVRD